MAKAFSVASWNVEHFGSAKGRTVDPILDFLVAQKADVVGIYEVASSKVFRPIVRKMREYQFHITEGPQTQEILIGIRKGLSAYVTQKVQFKSSQPTLRPGVLVSIFVDNVFYPLLFLHLKSSRDPKGFGLRDDMLDRAFRFRGVLEKAAEGAEKANYIFLGDLNTMGMNYFGSKHDIPGIDEIGEIERVAALSSKKMKLLSKNAPHTWWNGPGSSIAPSNLDHVVAADHIRFNPFQGKDVDVRGWPQEDTDSAKGDWIKKFSDQALLYFEVQKV